MGLVAPALVLFTACQAAGDASVQPTAQASASVVPAPVVPHPAILGVTQGLRPGEVVIRFDAGTSAATARAVGHQYGLDLTDAPLMTGPLPGGRNR